MSETLVPSNFEDSVPIVISEEEFANIVEIADETIVHPEPDARCTVCQASLGESGGLAILPCDHPFHINCIKTWLTEYSCKCPSCRYDVRQCQDEEDDDELPNGIQERQNY